MKSMRSLHGIAITIASVLAVVVVVLFFATSSDSGSLVVDILTNGGDPHPKWQQRLFWAVLEGVVAVALLVASAASGQDALTALQTASIVAGLPFCVVLLFMAAGLLRGLSSEPRSGSPEPSPTERLRASAVSGRHAAGTSGGDTSATQASEEGQ